MTAATAIRSIASLACGLGLACLAPGQDFGRVRPPVEEHGTLLQPEAARRTDGVAQTDPREDPGRPVQMLESPNIDRYLRRAQDFLARDDHAGAIKILQDVIEGRTLAEAPEAGDEPAEPAPEPPRTEQPVPGSEADDRAARSGTVWSDLVDDAKNAVFSADGRLYHPVHRLCHELLASLSAEGLRWYRARFEVEAEQALAEALRGYDPRALEAIYERWFLTRAAGKALQAAGELLMDQGRARGAIQVFRHLLEVYPAESRREIGIDDAALRFRIAVCFALIGEDARAREELGRLADESPDASLRIEGELIAADALPRLPLFAAAPSPARTGHGGVAALTSPQEELVPLFEHRFADQEPYRPARGDAGGRQQVMFVDGTIQRTAAPRRDEAEPGTSVTFDGDRLAFLDHFRLTVATLPGGLIDAQGEGVATVPDPLPGQVRHRIPSYDFASLRVAADDERYYVVVGPDTRRSSGMRAVTRTTMQAWSKRELAALWSTDEDEALADVTFLATPTPFGERLLVPVAVRDTFGLMCVDASSGKLVYQTMLHREGTEFARPPAVPVAVSGGTAYVLTNAGVLGAVDAFSGGLRWLRRYERYQPFRPAPSTQRRTEVNAYFRELPLYGFAPSDLVVRDGLVVFAPCDGRTMICVDGASGEPVWMVEQDDLTHLIGSDGKHVFAGSPDGVTCIELRSGVRLWRDLLPPHPTSSHWRGRGLVTGDLLVLPGHRGIHVRRIGEQADPGLSWHTLSMPSLMLGREPLQGSFNLFQDGPYLAAVYAGGIELYSTSRALSELAAAATDPLTRASLQAHAGDLTAAVGTLEAIDLEAQPELRPQVSRRMLTLCSELAVAIASSGAREPALAMLDRCRRPLRERDLLQRWRLARIEVFDALGDLESAAREQQLLYDEMETRG